MPCLRNAQCRGGRTLVPEVQYWHSAPDSEVMVACPNPSACQGDRDALAACQNPSNASLVLDAEHQVITEVYLKANLIWLPCIARDVVDETKLLVA